MIWRWWGNQLFTRKQGKGHHCLGVLSWTGFAVEQPQDAGALHLWGFLHSPQHQHSSAALRIPFSFAAAQVASRAVQSQFWGCLQSRDVQELPNLGIMALRGSVGWHLKDVWESLLNQRDPDSANCTETRELGRFWSCEIKAGSAQTAEYWGVCALWTFIAIFTHTQGTPEMEE